MHVDAVVCGLPWALFDEPTQQRGAHRGRARDRPDRGVHHLRLPARAWRCPPRAGSAARCARASRRCSSPRPVWRNMPPAFVYVCRRPHRVKLARAACRRGRSCGWPGPPCRCSPPSRCTSSSTRPSSAGWGRCRWPGSPWPPCCSPRSRASSTSSPTARRPAPPGCTAPGGAPTPSPRGCRPRGSRSPSALVVLGVGQLVARPVAEALGNGGAIAEGAVSWLRVALFGAPLLLVTLAGQRVDARRAGHRPAAALRPGGQRRVGGRLRGRSCTGSARSPGSGSSARRGRTSLGQCVGAGLFLGALVRESRALVAPPRRRCCAPSSPWAATCVARSLAFQACFLSAAAVATRFGAPVAAAHQVVLQLWSFMALVLDAVAIAAQSLVGAALGGGRRDAGRGRSRPRSRATAWSSGSGSACCSRRCPGCSRRCSRPTPPCSRPCPSPGGSSPRCSPSRGSCSPSTGCCSARATPRSCARGRSLAAVVGFLPLIWASLAFGWGLAGIWSGLAAFMLVRLVAVVLRVRGGRWAVTGVTPT